MNITWTEKNVKKYLKECGYEFNQVRGNGFCILAAVARALLFDHSYLASIGTIQERIIQHLLRRPDLCRRAMNNKGSLSLGVDVVY